MFRTTLTATLVGLTLHAGTAGACPPRPQRTVRPAPAPAPAAPPPQQDNAPPEADGAVWDLPSDKSPDGSVTAAGAPPAAEQPRPAVTTRPVQSFNDRVARAVAAQKSLAGLNARLAAKRAELRRWDDTAQEKFRQAFGTTDEAARQLVLRRVEQQMEQNSKLSAAIAETVNFEFYVRTKKGK